MRPIRAQWSAAKQLTENGATVDVIDSGLPSWMDFLFEEDQTGVIDAVTLRHQPVAAKDIEPLLQLPFLKRLYMPAAGATDEHCEVISRIHSLRRLALWRNQITDKGAVKLLGLPALEKLDLHNNPCTWRVALQAPDRKGFELKLDAQLRNDLLVRSDELPQLASLGWDVTGVTLAQPTDSFVLEALSTFPNLRQLGLDGGGSLTPTVLKQLLKQESLRKIWLLTASSERDHYRFSRHEKSLGIEHELDRSSLSQVFAEWGSAAEQIIVYEHMDRLDIGIVVDEWEDVIERKVLWVVVPTQALSAEEWSQMAGLSNVPRVKFGSIKQPPNVSAPAFGIAAAVPNAKRLELDPFEEISKESLHFLSKMTELELLWIKGATYLHDVVLPDDFFSQLGCQQALKRVGVIPRTIIPKLGPLRTYPKLENATIGGLFFARDEFDEMVEYEKDVEYVRSKQREEEAQARRARSDIDQANGFAN